MASGAESDTRIYYDMIAARQELALRPALERLDRVIAASEGLDASALTFAFRPLWQLDAATAATVALQKAQATQVYAALNLWPAATTARLVEAQLAEDGTYPNASAVFGEGRTEGPTSAAPTLDFDPDQPRDDHGRWTTEVGSGSPLTAGTTAESKSGAIPISPRRAKAGSTAPGGILGFLNALNPIGTAQAQEVDPEEENRREEIDPFEREPGDVLRIERFNAAIEKLREVDPENPHLRRLEPPNYVATEADILAIEQVAREALAARTCDPLRPDGRTEPKLGTASPAASLSTELPRDTPTSSSATLSARALLTAAEIAAHPFMRALKAIREGNMEEAEACKKELPPEVAARMIPGVVGPGPFATQSIPLPFGQDVTEEMRA